jgi:rod shape-determining protein MreD
MISFSWGTLFKKSIPLLLCLIIILLSQTPNIQIIFIPLVYIPIFYFAVFRPSLLNAYENFGLGIFTDLMSQTPFGLYSFLFVLLFFIARLNRLFLKDLSFNKLWALFAVCSGGILLITLFLFTIVTGTVINTYFLFYQYIILNLVYPLGVFLLGRLNDKIGV